jgi:hypothetical protein
MDGFVVVCSSLCRHAALGVALYYIYNTSITNSDVWLPKICHEWPNTNHTCVWILNDLLLKGNLSYHAETKYWTYIHAYIINAPDI